MIITDILKIKCIFLTEPASSNASTMDGDGFKVPLFPNVNSKPKSTPPFAFKSKSALPLGLNPIGHQLLASWVGRREARRMGHRPGEQKVTD